jgi:hypothetical protein
LFFIDPSSQKVHSAESDLQSGLLLIGVDVSEDVIEGLLIY